MSDSGFRFKMEMKGEIPVSKGVLMQNDLSDMVLREALMLYREHGLRFTMQQIAEELHISKKTIYTIYPSKEALLLSMVDNAFDEIHSCKDEILKSEGTVEEKLRAEIIALPEEYCALDLQQMKELEEKYPIVAARVHEQLESGWEPTIKLLKEAVEEGIIRPVSLDVLKKIIVASIESFLSDRSLIESGMGYKTVLEEMISIILEGVLTR